MPRQKITITGLATILTIVIALTIFLDRQKFFSRVESASFDHRVAKIRADKTLHADVMVILIDDESLRSLNQRFGRWPWPRNAFAELLEFFSQAGAETLAFDILFSETEIAGGTNENDSSLVEATANSGIAVHALQLLPQRANAEPRALPTDFARRFGLRAEDFTGPYYADYLLPFAGLYRASRNVGNLEIKPDAAGIYRRIRLFNRHSDGTILPSLASAVVQPLLSTDDRVASTPGRGKIGTLEIPLDGSGNYLVNPYGQVNVYSASAVFRTMAQLASARNEDLELDPALFEGKLVFVGASAIGLLDVKPTAMAAAEPGVFLHAYTVSNILHQDFLVLLPVGLRIALLLLVCSLSILSAWYGLRPSLAALAHLVIVAAWPAAAYAAFAFNLVLPVAAPMFAIFMSLLLAYFVRAHRQ